MGSQPAGQKRIGLGPPKTSQDPDRITSTAQCLHAVAVQRAWARPMHHRKSLTPLIAQNLTGQRSIGNCLPILVGRLSHGETGRWRIANDLKDDAQFDRQRY